MNRPIKFRMWDKEEKVMIDGDSLGFEEYAPICELLSQDGIMQSTGLHDSNGKETYEEDIVCFTVFDYNGADTQHKGVIKWIGTRFVIWHDNEQEYYGSDGEFDLGWVFAQDDEPEVIGNIYENPELLGESHE